jgi:hypothetical protein
MDLILKINKNIVKKIILKIFQKMIKKEQITRLCLGVKPPYEKRLFRHMMKFWKIDILVGG